MVVYHPYTGSTKSVGLKENKQTKSFVWGWIVEGWRGRVRRKRMRDGKWI